MLRYNPALKPPLSHELLTPLCDSLSACYNASKIGYMNVSIFMLLTPQVSLEIAFAGWVFLIAILVAYIIMIYRVEDDDEVKSHV